MRKKSQRFNMISDLDQFIDKITTTSLFLKLKDIVENVHGWHDQESVFDHSLKTANIAKKEREGLFITNDQAKKAFLAWMGNDVYSMKRKDAAVFIALLHDCGKLLQYKEASETKQLIITCPQTLDQTLCPGHEYWGGALMVNELLKNIKINNNLKNYIAKIVKLHDVFNNYFPGKKSWNTSELIQDIKSRAEGYYKEAMFNSYCDCYTASGFSYSKRKIEEIFNEPSFYIERTYFIPNE